MMVWPGGRRRERARGEGKRAEPKVDGGGERGSGEFILHLALTGLPPPWMPMECSSIKGFAFGLCLSRRILLQLFLTIIEMFQLYFFNCFCCVRLLFPY